MARRRGAQTKVYVKLRSLKYGFRTQKAEHEKHKAVTGQTTYQGAEGVFFGANSPKPPRAVYSGADTYSSFCSTDKVSDIQKLENWDVVKSGTRRGVRTSGKTRSVFVDMPGGWKYAWNITAAEMALAQDLGFVQATGANADDLVWGVNDPKPPRASITTSAGRQSSFIKPQPSVMDAATGKGYTLSSVDYALIPNAT
jgi:hypothetical protein